MKYLFVMISIFSMTVCQGKEVKLQHGKLSLNAELRMAKDVTHSAILILHGGLAHHDMETLKYIKELLHAKGNNLLSINLSLSLNDRHGMYDCQQVHRHKHEDAMEEITAWLNWLQKKGIRKVVLLAHSRGGAQAALYLAKHRHEILQGGILLAPATLENGYNGYEQTYGEPVNPILARAKKLINSGKGATPIRANMMFCRDTKVSAESFYSYYRNSTDLDAPHLLGGVKLPVLVVIASADELVHDLDKKLKTSSWVTKQIIDGADHFFRDLFADDAVDVIETFMKKQGWR